MLVGTVSHGRSKRRPLRRLLAVVFAGAAVGAALLPGWFRLYVVTGGEGAPALRHGDRILVSRLSYDLWLPYADIRLAWIADPQRGDLVLCRPPWGQRGGYEVVRIVALPGERVECRGPRLWIDGRPLDYLEADPVGFRKIPLINRLGGAFTRERGLGLNHWIAYSPGDLPERTTGPVAVPPRHYYALGDNRSWNGGGSNHHGSLVARDRICGRYWRTVDNGYACD
jgi:signal peptidase I